ncbi:MAG: hypothetical protein HQL52_18400 [Magnetococcales bacterium]|nr:hypothetical protein [Magnetococcales bacterium]
MQSPHSLSKNSKAHKLAIAIYSAQVFSPPPSKILHNETVLVVSLSIKDGARLIAVQKSMQSTLLG